VGGSLGIEDRTASGTGYALTFDDGPHPRGTPAVLEILAEAGVRATFFLVGEQVLRNPALAAEIVAAGHGVGLHCHRHRNLLRLTPRQVREDILRARGHQEATGAPRRSTARPTGCPTPWPSSSLVAAAGDALWAIGAATGAGPPERSRPV
jgi:peptidoglycan/xylan/chitin deacetylase (PgdA/CDA1 family)